MSASNNPNSSFPDGLPAGTRLRNGGFVLERVLGQGGFGITYRATDEGLHRTAAVKEFFPQGSQRVGLDVVAVGHGTDEFNAARERFLAEARTLAQFNHPNIVNVYTIFEENNSAYMVMEYLDGTDLQNLVEKRGPLPEREAVGIIEQVASALEVVHRAGMLHLDVKPDNMILDESTPGRTRAVLLDFGLTRKVESATGYATTRLDAFARFGTAGYAPLEQYSRVAKTGAYTDIYALSATLYFLLTGQAPPEASDRASGTDLPDVRSFNPNVSTPVAGALAIGLAMEPASRPQSIDAFLDLLRAPAPQQQQRSTPAAPPTPSPVLHPPQPRTPPQQPAPRRQHDDEERDDHEELVEELMDQLFGPGQQNDPFGRRPRRRPRPFPFPQPMPRRPQNDPFGQTPQVRFSGCGCAPGCIVSGIIFLFFLLSMFGAMLEGY